MSTDHLSDASFSDALEREDDLGMVVRAHIHVEATLLDLINLRLRRPGKPSSGGAAPWPPGAFVAGLGLGPYEDLDRFSAAHNCARDHLASGSRQP